MLYCATICLHVSASLWECAVLAVWLCAEQYHQIIMQFLNVPNFRDGLSVRLQGYPHIDHVAVAFSLQDCKTCRMHRLCPLPKPDLSTPAAWWKTAVYVHRL